MNQIKKNITQNKIKALKFRQKLKTFLVPNTLKELVNKILSILRQEKLNISDIQVLEKRKLPYKISFKLKGIQSSAMVPRELLKLFIYGGELTNNKNEKVKIKPHRIDLLIEESKKKVMRDFSLGKFFK